MRPPFVQQHPKIERHRLPKVGTDEKRRDGKRTGQRSNRDFSHVARPRRRQPQRRRRRLRQLDADLRFSAVGVVVGIDDDDADEPRRRRGSAVDGDGSERLAGRLVGASNGDGTDSILEPHDADDSLGAADSTRRRIRLGKSAADRQQQSADFAALLSVLAVARISGVGGGATATIFIGVRRHSSTASTRAATGALVG